MIESYADNLAILSMNSVNPTDFLAITGAKYKLDITEFADEGAMVLLEGLIYCKVWQDPVRYGQYW